MRAIRGSCATENPWAPEHIEGLPPDIRRGILARERACGGKAAAAHYFSVSIEAGGCRFVPLHFEDFACANRAAVCNGGGCMHEVYLESHGRHRLWLQIPAKNATCRKKLSVTEAAGVAAPVIVVRL